VSAYLIDRAGLARRRAVVLERLAAKPGGTQRAPTRTGRVRIVRRSRSGTSFVSAVTRMVRRCLSVLISRPAVRAEVRGLSLSLSLLLADEQVDTGDIRLVPDDCLPVRVVVDEIRLDHPDRPAVELDDEVLVRIEVILRMVVAPPQRHMLPLAPRL